MTTVVIRKIEQRLERMVRTREGLRPNEALAAAEENLLGMRADCLAEVDQRLAVLHQFGERHPKRRPPDGELETLLADAEAALTACGALDMPFMGDALVMLCAMVDALRHSDQWPDGALAPALGFIGLARRGALPDEIARKLLNELDRCLQTYVAAADNCAGEQVA